MTRITEPRAIGNHADMGPAPATVAQRPVVESVRAGTAPRELTAAESRWDSEGGSVEP